MPSDPRINPFLTHQALANMKQAAGSASIGMEKLSGTIQSMIADSARAMNESAKGKPVKLDDRQQVVVDALQLHQESMQRVREAEKLIDILAHALEGAVEALEITHEHWRGDPVNRKPIHSHTIEGRKALTDLSAWKLRK